MKWIILASLSMLGACASIADGKNQTVSIMSEPMGAKCQLYNDKGTWHIPETPGSVTVSRSLEDITVDCKKGTLAGTARAASTTKSMAYGNILFGGIIGVAVDRSNGSGFDYPQQIHVPMKKGGNFIQIGEHYELKKEEAENNPAGNPSGITPSYSVRNR